ncbi:uncharacterized protein TOT_030000727 [Theileria orientalis strain Shintoku]|uniref:Syntaxin binding protein n=1 Tax=Theileria orientalis strain Shintoku TaxID=869250 RepID=J4D9L5_THEOR|nr:uncharacterized protein TOT_030000727 [Theileria orientalis strain Shintoku]PVC53795.1 hypothetical protein MACL_00003488 [Theileria orientalis]BAM41465.1 uncharacterized protein TOT_030000727 [Theileria orientalis strain Shintoku]|eukprot:XP_009691766.1 uncharacterized protein TOT_030000727 [Theileria orientalis strain Shintoku]
MSLKQAAKERLLWAIKQVVIPFGRIIMLVDPKSLKVISSCCSVSDLLDEGVDLVELLTKKREPLKGKYVLCMLSDDFSYLDLLLKDFARGKERYMGVFIMFNCHLKDDSVLKKIAAQMDFDKVLGCFELHMNFVTFESNVFFTQNYYFKDLYNMLASQSTYAGLNSGRQAPNDGGRTSASLQEYVDKVASRVASVCSVLNVQPKVSFYKTKYGVTGMVASAVERLLITTLDAKASTNSELIIFDRSVDFSPLFIHEYTYQAFIYDLVQIDYCTYQDEQAEPQLDRAGSSLKRSPRMDKFDNCFKYKLITASNKDEVKEALLDPEQDFLYKEYMHLHIQQVNAKVSEEINKISDDTTSQGKSDSSMQNTLDLVRRLPNYQYTFDKCWAHLRLSERCFKYVESRQLVKVGVVEQMIATNMDSSGKHVSHSKCLEKLQEALAEPLDDNDKVRLILLYLTNYTNLTRAHLSKLTLRLSPRALSVLNNVLSRLPVTSLSSGDPANAGETDYWAQEQSHSDSRSKDRDKDDKSKDSKVVHRIEKGELYNYYKKVHSEYELSRYLSEIIFVLLQYVNHHFSHPLIQSATQGPPPGEKKHKNHDNLESFNMLLKSGHEERKKLIVYVLGGISFSECREIYRLCERKNVDVYLGGDEILIPSKLMEEFSN